MRVIGTTDEVANEWCNVLFYEPIFSDIHGYVDGKIEKKLDLNKNQEYRVNVDNGYNIIRIKDKKAKIKESDCSNQTCVNMGTISKDGQTLICLPHKVEVTIVSDDKSEVDVIAR